MCRWLRKKKAKAEKEKAAKLAKRSDAKLANVIICERWDKKAAKFTVPELPFPYTQNNVRTSPHPVAALMDNPSWQPKHTHADTRRPHAPERTGIKSPEHLFWQSSSVGTRTDLAA